MLEENYNLLKQYATDVLIDLKSYEQLNSEKGLISEVIDTKSGQKTIQVLMNGSMQLLHSKYDPKKEAEKFISQFENIVDKYEHVLFYGVGFGYHIKEFMIKYPTFTYSLYEPEIEVFYQFVKNCNLREIQLERINDICIETTSEKGSNFIDIKIHNIQERVLVITLPSYERIFKEKFNLFSKNLKTAMESKRQSHRINMKYSARWTLNSLLNLSENLQNFNILDGYGSYFKNKPLIIVSAGPSLDEEFENLRLIKKKRLAYIFAVGSANRALISQNIMPDAICTYDPQKHNYGVFSKMYEKGVDSVPLIYGTSVGFETLKMYKGPKYHMITDQDSVSTYYLKKKNKDDLKLVQDSPTIAAVAFQLGANLGCNPIVLVGQNLGFKNDKIYSKDIDYKGRSEKVMDNDRVNSFMVEDVYGNQIETNSSFNNMRQSIEWCISKYSGVETINATKGGAAIFGAKFISLESLIKNRLNDTKVDDSWRNNKPQLYDLESIQEKINNMEKSIKVFRKQYIDIALMFKELNLYIKSNKSKKIVDLMVNFDKKVKMLIETDCYKVYIEPVNREFLQALSIKSASIRKQTNEILKAKLIIEAFQPYIERCKQTLEQIVSSIYSVHKMILELIENNNDYKYYSNDCGVFKYIGNWRRVNYGPGKNINYYLNQTLTNVKESTISFRFLGNTLRIYGSRHTDGSKKIELKIDGRSIMFSQKKTGVETSGNPRVKEVLVEVNTSENQEHIVQIILKDDNTFIFSGIEVNREGYLYHIDEVSDIKDLVVGKRIRCHYKAPYNKVGVFNGLGEETSTFIPVESSAYPDGDFYFIMVDGNSEKKKLIADRNIQNFISWETLNQFGFGINKGVIINQLNNNNYKAKMNLLYGDSEGDFINEWNQYIIQSDLDGYITAGSDLVWNWSGQVGAWTNSNKYNKNQHGETTMPIRSVFLKDKNWYGENAEYCFWGLTTNVNSIFAFRPILSLNNE
ncbi:motility associated factor glycosyltransferase family protein [Bacillus sp. S/N-304-OC-R1]|uniref:motility associated factor glycosyltransferase family protein n=1 Tax=Bacillus sp. S/N-304-OC-R1 TaxID=2758034 RepID=UPI001C8D790B|nr:6-hydroxymethylpterin diphosphokinase MptE-like protein [Bacillus sp. S/N-304-OC-R1]MBY0123461.1 motility associated factor glycosyltransferase family protein [Bacillus sp. S/N-304-OC-R1]